MKQIAIQGIEGSFHDIAAHRFFEGEQVELVCCDTFEEMFARLKGEQDMLGLMAIENTIAGSLLHNYELLRESGMTIVGEHKLRIRHSIMCLPDESWEDITEVNSHPVALMQCRQFLSRHPEFKKVETADTAGAAADISREGRHGHAAICHRDAADIYGMKVLQEGIETNKHNFTRFLVLAHPEKATAIRNRGSINKASLVFTLPHEEGSLSAILSVLSFYKLNLTKIQSLPIIGQEWQYMFYIDLSFNDEKRYRQALNAITPLTRELKQLGIYEDGKQSI
ncbi:MAG: prephenate dehydratase [Bacteroidaceae bacterium]|nr:prephenate dehydratase [Bacteroidaceae bacterium]MBQ8454137.1 prephenate dehydratase [Bacteroidaceae bacterium]MBQ9170239.1 prephenate dehydratase [Bacteroidaceae bacterium]MBQ9295511.1 prephenate dehydratase [Bacteroidaceae bacterium]